MIATSPIVREEKVVDFGTDTCDKGGEFYKADEKDGQKYSVESNSKSIHLFIKSIMQVGYMVFEKLTI